MPVTICTGKLHRLTVTKAKLNYTGSITIDPVLMEAAGIMNFRLVHINSMTTAEAYANLENPSLPGG